MATGAGLELRDNPPTRRDIAHAIGDRISLNLEAPHGDPTCVHHTLDDRQSFRLSAFKDRNFTEGKAWPQ